MFILNCVVNSISNTCSFINYTVNTTAKTINKIAINTTATKKLLRIGNSAFAAYDLYKERAVQVRPITEASKGMIDIFELYGTFNDLQFWLYPFSKETVDQTVLQASLDRSISAVGLMRKSRKKNRKNLSKEIFEEAMKASDFNSEKEVRESIKATLIDKGAVITEQAQKVANSIQIQQKPRPIIEKISMVCFTLVDIADTFATFKKWNIVDISSIAIRIGSQSRVVAYVVNLGADTIFGPIGLAGVILTFGNVSYQAVISTSKYYYAKNLDDKDRAAKELKSACVDVASTGIDLVSTIVPLMFALNPPALLALGLVSTGTGLVLILFFK